jgi:hypothetical protein
VPHSPLPRSAGERSHCSYGDAGARRQSRITPQRLGPGPYPGRASSPYWELLSEQVRCILFGNYEDKDAVTSAFGLKSTARAGDGLTICSCLKSATLDCGRNERYSRLTKSTGRLHCILKLDRAYEFLTNRTGLLQGYFGNVRLVGWHFLRMRF